MDAPSDETPKKSAIKPSALVIGLAAIAVVATALVLARPEADGDASGNAGADRASLAFGEMRAPAVSLARVRLEPIEQTLTAVGTGRALQSVMINTEVPGVVEEIHVEAGSFVQKGDPILRLESRQQEIAVARARANYKIAQTNAERFRGLVADEAASSLEYEAAQNELTSTEAALRQAEYDLAQRSIRAPFAGVIGLTDLDVGDFVSVGSAITSIDDVSELLVDFVIPEGASTFVREGLEITASAASAGGRAYKGRIRSIDSRIDPVSRTRRVQAALANEDQRLIPGATFTISMSVPGREAARVSGLAVQWDRAGSFVWKLSPNGVAERTPVVIAQRTSDAVLLEAALTEKDYIVSEGADLVRAGMPLPAPRDRREEPTSVGAAAPSATSD